MGQTLSEPVTTKETATACHRNIIVGSSSMQGWRINMEDAHTHILSLEDDEDASFFAVFDGHGGHAVAEYAGSHLHKKLVQTDAYANERYEEALRDAFLEIDRDMLSDDTIDKELGGATAVCVLLKNNRLYCANAGDSRAIISVAGVAEPLSYDHKPSNESESRRIVAAGGYVEFGRVNGNLALSRALGDFLYKQNKELSEEEQIVTAAPDIVVRDLSPDVEFLVLACDGIWDVLSNQEVVDFVRKQLANGCKPETICEELLSHCLAPDVLVGGLGCDNMTIVLVLLLQENTWEQYVAKCTQSRPRMMEDSDNESLSNCHENEREAFSSDESECGETILAAQVPLVETLTSDRLETKVVKLNQTTVGAPTPSRAETETSTQMKSMDGAQMRTVPSGETPTQATPMNDETQTALTKKASPEKSNNTKAIDESQ